MKKENTVLTDYDIKGILGKGTFSKVKLGINKITKEKVAIKIIDKQFALNQNIAVYLKDQKHLIFLHFL